MKTITYILIKLIQIYKFLISPLFGNSCRYFPTCSQYSIEALKHYGLFKGFFKSIKRIFSCHPLKFLGGGEGFDPVINDTKDMKVKK
jgi:putative membrane protein insertion efficiency factor